MVLMTAGSVLDPVFDPMAPLTALAHALWDGRQGQVHQGCEESAARQLATMDRRRRTVRRGRRDFGSVAVDYLGATFLSLVHEEGLPTQHAQPPETSSAGVAMAPRPL